MKKGGCTGAGKGGQAPAPHLREGSAVMNGPILEIRKLRQGLVQGHTAEKWPTNLSSHNCLLVELQSFPFLGKNELFPLESGFLFLSLSLIVVYYKTW